MGERARNWERVIECVRGREIDDEERVRVCARVHECRSERESKRAPSNLFRLWIHAQWSLNFCDEKSSNFFSKTRKV